MKQNIKASQWLPATGLVLGLGLAFWAWPRSSETGSTETSAPGSRRAAAPSGGFTESRETNLKGPSDSLRKDADFLARAEALRARIDARTAPEKVYESEVRQLLAAWAQVDPEAALTFALSPTRDGTNEVFFKAAGAALSVWTQKEPEVARIYLEHLAENPQMVAVLAPAMMRTYADLSPTKAKEWVQSGFNNDSGELRPVLARELVSVMMEKGKGREVEQWLANPKVAESAYALPAVSEYSRLLAKRDVKAALAFSQDLPRGTMSRGLALQNAVQVWASRDADKTYDWITGKTAIDQSHPELFTGSGKKPPLPAEAYTSDELDYAISGYVLALAPTSPSEAMESAAGIQDPSLRKRIQQQVNALNLSSSSKAGS